ncbi:MAG: O-antigen ligase family protein [Anaerolineae bacterium]
MHALQRVLTRGRGWHLAATLAVCVLAAAAMGALVALLKPIYALALVLGAAGGLLILRDRRLALAAVVAVICLLPFASVPLNVGFSPTFLNLVLAAYLFVWVMRIATRAQTPRLATPLAAVVAIYILMTLASFVAGLGHASLNATALRKFAEVPLGIAIFFAVLDNLRDRQDLEQATVWLIIGGAVSAAIGCVLYVLPRDLSTRLLSALGTLRYPSGPDVLRFIEDNPSLPMRAISTQVDPNVLGALLVLTIGLTAPHLFAPRPPLTRHWLTLCAAVSGVCLILTFSRGSFAGLAAGLLLLSLAPGYRRLWLLMLGAGALILLLPQTRAYVAHFLEGLQGQDLATQMRLGEYKDAFILIQRYPWLGVGFIDAPDIDIYLGVSSLYLLIAEQMGIAGMLVFMLTQAVYFGTLIGAWRTDRARGGALSPWLLGPAVAVLGGLVGGIVDHTLASFPHALTLFWLIVGLGAATARLAKQQQAATLFCGAP